MTSVCTAHVSENVYLYYSRALKIFEGLLPRSSKDMLVKLNCAVSMLCALRESAHPNLSHRASQGVFVTGCCRLSLSASLQGPRGLP